MQEDMDQLREKLVVKEKRILELENRVFFELADVRKMLQRVYGEY